MYKHDTMLHLVWTFALADGVPGAEKNETPEEDSYLDTVRKQEGIKIDWDDFNAKRKSLNYNRERIIDKACKALRGCAKDWKIKCIGYMQRMGWMSQEDELENNMSDKEWALVLSAQKELGLTNDERKNAYQLLPKNNSL